MLSGQLRPTTIDGVKSLAAQLRKEQGIKHAVALDLAAKAANCENYPHARRTLPLRIGAPTHPYVLLTIYWLDKDQRYRRGRETLRIEISKRIFDLCPKPALKKLRGLGDFRMVAEDHFVCDWLAHTQDFARNTLCTAERSIRFIEYTGLHPCQDHRKANPKSLADDPLPNADHSSNWVDPISGQFVLVDEPYSLAPNHTARDAWAARNGWRVVKTYWPGMYNPYACNLFVASDGATGYDLDALVAKINGMPKPLIADDWNGESSPSWQTFVSPMAKTKQDKRRARCHGTIYPISSATTVPYSYGPGSRRRRPAAELGIDTHTEVGRIIKAVLRSGKISVGIYNRLNSLRSTLEDWLSLEIGPDELQGPEFFEVYYRDTDADKRFGEGVKTHANITAILSDLRQKLTDAYPDCAPLRQQLQRIDMSISLIGRAIS